VFHRLLQLREYFELTDPYWAEIVMVQEFLAVAAEYGFEIDTARALNVGRTTYVQAIRDGVFTRLVSILRDYDAVDVEGTPGEAKRPLSTEVPIIVGELHCPAIDDAKATFEEYNEFRTPLTLEHVDHTEWEETYEYSGRWGFDASLDGQKIGGGVTYKSTFTTTMKIDVLCPRGYRYISRFRSDRELPQQWAAEAL